jgi:molybdopterin-binding protein
VKISARNQFKGKIKSLVKGPVNSEVVIELPGGVQVTAVITTASAQSLGLKKGKEAFAVVKASDVMIGLCCGNGDCDCGCT